MNKTMISKSQTYEIQALEQTPTSCVIFLHGYGANGQDLIGIANEWQSALPDTVFISPDAPQPCEMGGGGRQWFSLAEYSIPAMEREIKTVWPQLEQYIMDVSKHYAIPLNKIVLCGFSQGTMMSLYALPRINKPMAGVLGYSGRLLDEDAFKDGQNKQTPIRLIHGEVDMVVPLVSWSHANEVLTTNGYTVDGHTTPNLPHGIDAKGIASGLEFIKSILTV
jgi:phospholipase/carboxylesterase